MGEGLRKKIVYNNYQFYENLPLQNYVEREQKKGFYLSKAYGRFGSFLLFKKEGEREPRLSLIHILDVNEGNIPYKKALTEEDLEEERRMFYVGMTRAKERLHLLYTRKQNDRKAEISRFLNEIQEEQPCAEKPLPSGRKR